MSSKDRVQIKGFRRGKVPLTHLKKLYGKSLMQEVMEQTLNDTSAKVIKDRNERPAQQPKVELVDFNEGTFERIVNGEADLAYQMSFEVLAADSGRRPHDLEARAPRRRRRRCRDRQGVGRSRRAQHRVRTRRGPRRRARAIS